MRGIATETNKFSDVYTAH